MMEFGELKRILAAFEREGVRYVLVGSMAMAAQGIVRARVATPRMLYRMKNDTVRPQDRMDADRLRLRFGLKDE